MRAANSPSKLRKWVADDLGCVSENVIVAGPIDRRVVIVRIFDENAIAAALYGTLGSSGLVEAGVHLEEPDSTISRIVLPNAVLDRLTRPTITLVALYHPEVFPLPRFALGISDIARAVRSELHGQVRLVDMQLGLSGADVLAELQSENPDIVGISATFGQHDILTEVLAGLYTSTPRPMIVVGGSLAALNAAHLLESYPDILIASSAGEETMTDVVAYWHGDIRLDDVRGLARSEVGERRGNKIKQRHIYSEYIPELDLLGSTLTAGGVMQLESSRGCTHSCSFCPREHKGIWAGGTQGPFQRLLPHIASEYDDNPLLARRIFLVDEEFVGLAGC